MTGMATCAIGRPAAVISERDLNLEQRVQDAVGRSVGRSLVWALVGRSVNRSVGASKTKKVQKQAKNHEEGGVAKNKNS